MGTALMSATGSATAIPGQCAWAAPTRANAGTSALMMIVGASSDLILDRDGLQFSHAPACPTHPLRRMAHDHGIQGLAKHRRYLVQGGRVMRKYEGAAAQATDVITPCVLRANGVQIWPHFRYRPRPSLLRTFAINNVYLRCVSSLGPGPDPQFQPSRSSKHIRSH